MHSTDTPGRFFRSSDLYLQNSSPLHCKASVTGGLMLFRMIAAAEKILQEGKKKKVISEKGVRLDR